MTALQSEDAIDAPPLEKTCDPCRDAILAGAEILC
jgi:hypothetical protein